MPQSLTPKCAPVLPEQDGGPDRNQVAVRSLPISLGAAILALLIGALTWRHGVLMTADSWAYWQGSVSLLHGDGYRFFFGHLSIKDWPPGYSAYLAAWQAVLGVSGKTLAVANVALGAAAAFGWSWVLLRLLGPLMGEGKSPPRLVAGVVVLYATLMVNYGCTYALADNLKYALAPWLLLASVTAAQATANGPFLKWVLAAGAVGAALMLSHNGSVALVAAGCAVILFGRVPVGLRVGGAALLGAVSLGPWVMVTRALGQTGTHDIGLGVANTSPRHYANQLAAGLGELFASRPALGCLLLLLPVGLIVWGWVRGRGPDGPALVEDERRVVGLCTLFTVVAIVSLYTIFNITWIQDPIGSLEGRRYLLFAPLILVPLGLTLGGRRLPPAAFFGTAVVLMLLPLIQVAGSVARHPAIVASAVSTGQASLIDRLGLDYTIRPGFVSRPPMREGERLVISPPFYLWLRRQLAPPPGPQ